MVAVDEKLIRQRKHKIARALNASCAWQDSIQFCETNFAPSLLRGENRNLDSQGNPDSLLHATSGFRHPCLPDLWLRAISGFRHPCLNLTTDQNGNTLKYDAWNRLISVTNSSGQLLAEYSYNALSQRVTETYPVAAPGIPANTTKNLYYSTGGQIIEERWNGTASSATQYQYVWSATYVNAMILRDTFTAGTIQPNLRVYTLNDTNYNVTALVTYNAATQTWGVSERFVYSPYGSVLVLNASFTSIPDAFNWQYMYQGGRFDTATGLYHFGARNYSPSLGIWISQDPAVYINGANTYQMEMSGPVSLVDPFGLAGAPAPGSFSFSLSQAFLLQQVQVVKKRIAELIDKLKETVSLQINYQVDKEAKIWVKVAGTSSASNPYELINLASTSATITGGWEITAKGGSKATGTLSLTPGTGGGAPSASASFNYAPGSGGGFGFGITGSQGAAGFSGSSSQSYSATISGIKTQIKMQESLAANGAINFGPSATVSYPVPGTPLTVGGGVSGLFSTTGSPLYNNDAFVKFMSSGWLGATATFCQSSSGASGWSVGPSLKWKASPNSVINFGFNIFGNTSSSPIQVPGGGNIPGGGLGTGVNLTISN